MRKPILFYFTIIVMSGFAISTTGQSQLRKLYLHPTTVATEKQIRFVDSLRFMPLEIIQGIEPGTNYNITVTEKYILLTDYINNNLLVYSKAGRFVKMLNYKKLGDGFYPSYKELTNQVIFFGNNKNYLLTPTDLVKIKLDWNNPRNRKYFKKYKIDLNDSLLSIKKDIPDEKDIVQVHHLYGDYYMHGQISVSPLYKDSVDYEVKMYKNNLPVKRFFPYNPVNEPRFLFVNENVGFNETDTANIHIITRPFCDTVYKMKGDSLSAAYKLVLPLENTLPASFYSKPFKNKTERDNFYRNNGWMLHQVYNFYETPRFIYFMVGYLSNFDSYIYEKQTDIMYKTKNVKPDTSHYNLQLLQGSGIMREAGTFYKSFKAGDLITFFDKNKNVAIPKDLEEFLKSKPPAATPVIAAFKLKK